MSCLPTLQTFPRIRNTTQSSTYLTELQELKNTMTFFFKFFLRKVNRSRNLLSAGHTTYLCVRTRKNGWMSDDLFAYFENSQRERNETISARAHNMRQQAIQGVRLPTRKRNANVPLLESVCRRVLLAIVNSNVQRLLLE